jgi:hypothetical protein
MGGEENSSRSAAYGKKRGFEQKVHRLAGMLASHLLNPSSPLAIPLLTTKTIKQQ